ncbi:hypothetical protein DXU93_10055 [Brumimicrobium aurantiacum]|uniref:Uncharacterized protein n=2 Tax=Brumimicrobium aurantiacum TaxID=1737063 RepID=A0A3E1EWI6_9FLAO|nr:hypothetical protein DXU93_10055 [Brumimicrobium aurantiacum]
MCLSFILAIFSCKKVDEYTQFEINNEQTIEIKSNAVINVPFDIVSPEVETDAESTFESNDTRKNLIETIELRSLTMEITTPEEGDFNFLNEIKIYISSDNHTETLIAWKENIPENSSSTLVLETSGEDLKKYVKEDTYKLRFNTITDQSITTDHKIKVNSTFFVDAEIYGI